MTILYEYTKPSLILILWACLIIIGVIGAGRKFMLDEDWRSAAWAFVVMLMIGIVGCVFWTPCHTRCDVVFDAQPSIQSVQEEYKVIGQKGLIWTLEKRDAND